ncbi:DUF4175 domain-containing protein [bacterium]|nr:DUF4175 domain-containing protein [bacterium]
MLNEYKSLSEEELDEKMEDVMKRMNAAHAMGHDVMLEQLQFILENMQMELTERMDKMRYDMINERMPNSLVIGEDDGKNRPSDSD